MVDIVDNGYTTEEIKTIRRNFIDTDPRTWPYSVIVMPVDAGGRGPCPMFHCDKLTWEVWDYFFNSYGSFDYLADAIKFAMEKNKELFGD